MQTDPWENDGTYFDGAGWAEVTLQNELQPRGDRLEQEVKVVSRNGILIMLQNGVKPFAMQPEANET